MASRRKLKKYINKTVGLLFTDCLVYKLYIKDADQNAADEIINKLKDLQSEYICRISVNEGRGVSGHVKYYYQKLISDFILDLNMIGKEIASL